MITNDRTEEGIDATLATLRGLLAAAETFRVTTVTPTVRDGVTVGEDGQKFANWKRSPVSVVTFYISHQRSDEMNPSDPKVKRIDTTCFESNDCWPAKGEAPQRELTAEQHVRLAVLQMMNGRHDFMAGYPGGFIAKVLAVSIAVLTGADPYGEVDKAVEAKVRAKLEKAAEAVRGA